MLISSAGGYHSSGSFTTVPLKNMNSIKCPSCGLVNFAGAQECKRCKESLTETSSVSHPQASFAPNDRAYAGEALADASTASSSDAKSFLKILPFVIFGVPMFLVLKDRMFDPPAKVGGYVDTLQLSILVGCVIGLSITGIVLFLTRKE